MPPDVSLHRQVSASDVPRAALEHHLETGALVAREICGECVPRSDASEVKGWMDRVQQLGHALTAAGMNGRGRA